MAVERQLGAVAFIELHRHENMIRKVLKQKPISEEEYARDFIERHAEHV